MWKKKPCDEWLPNEGVRVILRPTICWFCRYQFQRRWWPLCTPFSRQENMFNLMSNCCSWVSKIQEPFRYEECLFLLLTHANILAPEEKEIKVDSINYRYILKDDLTSSEAVDDVDVAEGEFDLF